MIHANLRYGSIGAFVLSTVGFCLLIEKNYLGTFGTLWVFYLGVQGLGF